MKEKRRDWLIVFALCLPVVLSLGWRIFNYATRYETVVVTENQSGLVGVSISFSEAAETEIGLPILPYTVTNNSALQITQNDIRIETKRSDGTWEYRKLRKQGPQPGGGAIEIPPGSCLEDYISLQQLSPGNYRLAWEYFTAVDFEITYYTAYAEFTVP